MLSFDAVRLSIRTVELSCCAPYTLDGKSFFFFQAEDGIRDSSVTGVQTCALPISGQPVLPADAQDAPVRAVYLAGRLHQRPLFRVRIPVVGGDPGVGSVGRHGADLEIGKRRVGKECRSRWSPYH